jgi:MFS family permease
MDRPLEAPADLAAVRAERRWVLSMCLTRLGFTGIPAVYAAVQPLLMSDWAMTGGQAGWVHSVFILGYMVSLFCAGFLVDRYGARNVYLASSVLAMIATGLFAVYARSYVSALVLMGLAALCKGGVYTPMFNIFSHQIAPRRRGRAIGLYVAAGDAGNALWLAATSTVLRYSDWRALFLLAGVGPVLGTGLAWWNLRHIPNVVTPPDSERLEPGRLRTVLSNRAALLNTWRYAWHNWELFGMRAWIPTFLTAVAGGGLIASASAASEAAIFAGAMYLMAIGGNIVGGSMSDLFGRGRVILFMACASMGCSFAIGWLVALPLWLVVLVGLIYNFTAIGDSAALSAQLTEQVPARYLGAAYSVRSVLGFAPGILSPWIFGQVVDWGSGSPSTLGPYTWGMAFCSLGIGALLGPLASILSREQDTPLT